MNEFSQVTIDVRDMLCAQALAQAGLAMKRVQVDGAIDVFCNSADVEHDLRIWANELGHVLLQSRANGGEWHLLIQKGSHRPS